MGLTSRGVTGISFWGCKFLSVDGETGHIVPMWVMILQSVKSFVIVIRFRFLAGSHDFVCGAPHSELFRGSLSPLFSRHQEHSSVMIKCWNEKCMSLTYALSLSLPDRIVMLRYKFTVCWGYRNCYLMHCVCKNYRPLHFLCSWCMEWLFIQSALSEHIYIRETVSTSFVSKIFN